MKKNHDKKFFRLCDRIGTVYFNVFYFNGLQYFFQTNFVIICLKTILQ